MSSVVVETELSVEETRDYYTFPDPSESHYYDIHTRGLLVNVPSSLILDLEFLKVLFGETLLVKQSSFTAEKLFPNICLPPFMVKIYITGRKVGLTLRYKCCCNRALSLYCQALKTYVLGIWIKTLRKIIRKATVREPEPKLFVTDFLGLNRYCADLLFNYNNPITCLYEILRSPEMQNNYAIGREGRVVRLYATPPFLSYEVHSHVCLLQHCNKKLPFTLVVDIYPFIKLTVPHK